MPAVLVLGMSAYTALNLITVARVLAIVSDDDAAMIGRIVDAMDEPSRAGLLQYCPANDGAKDFLEGLRAPEDKTIPPPPDYAEELVMAVADPTGAGFNLSSLEN